MENNEIGRRERKKIAMRDALIKASYELFATKGFDETRIEDITDSVDVSKRTFFRYFASKEDVVLDYQRAEHSDLIEALNNRPDDEPMLTAVRNAAVAVVRGCESGSYGFNADRFMVLQNLIRNHTLIQAKNIQHGDDLTEAIKQVIAQRMDVSAIDDVRPGLIAGAIEYAQRAAYDVWKQRNKTTLMYSDVLDEVFSHLESGLNFLPKSSKSAH